MGVLDIPKMIAKANEARKKAKQVKAAGTAGSVSILIDGLMDWVEEEVNEEDILQRVGATGESAEKVKKTIKVLRDDFKNAFKDAKKHLEKEMQSSISQDDIKDLLQNM